jgi:hypothetical protein
VQFYSLEHSFSGDLVLDPYLHDSRRLARNYVNFEVEIMRQVEISSEFPLCVMCFLLEKKILYTKDVFLCIQNSF